MIDRNLPPARLVPKDRADQVAVLRAQASDGARKAGRVAVTVGKGVAILALCGLGLGALGSMGSNRYQSRALDDLDRSMARIRNLPKMPKLDTLEVERMRLEIQQLMLDPELQKYRSMTYRRQLDLGTGLMREDVHAR